MDLRKIWFLLIGVDNKQADTHTKFAFVVLNTGEEMTASTVDNTATIVEIKVYKLGM